MVMKVLLYKTKSKPVKHMFIYQDEAGFYYPKVLYDLEAFETPFFSIAEIELYCNESLEQVEINSGVV